MRKTVTLLLWLFLIAPWALAQDDAEAVDTDELRYINLTPAFVTNYGGPGRMRYIKAEVTVQVSSAEALRAVTYHAPSLRHALVMLLSRQEEDRVESIAGQEQIRVEALAAAQEAMQAEVGDPTIEELLFTTFYVQN